MTATANGWPQLTKFSARFTAPTGGSCPVASTDLATLFAYVAWRMDTEVAHLTSAYGGRTIAEQIQVYKEQGISTPDMSSNHISGTACDFAKPGVVYERFQSGSYRSGYTAAQEQRIRAICTATGVMQWGGDFHAGFRDPVHIQVRENLSKHGQRVISAAAVAAAAKRIGAWVKGVQKVVGVTGDGIPGPATIQAVKDWQKAKHLEVDGIWGPASQAAAAGQTTTPKPPPATSVTTQLQGVDVSSYQTVAQWKARNPRFVLAKAHEGLSWHDPAYQAHRAAARAGGVLFGAYTYAWPEYDAAACCTDFLATAGLRTGEVGVMDFEPYKSTSNPATWPAWLIRFGTEYRRRTGVWPWLYANDDMLTRLAQHATTAQMNVLRTWPLWKAAYTTSPGSLHGWPALACWQHTDKPLDLDVFYGDPATFRRLGVGGNTTTPTAPTQKEEGDDMPDQAPEHSWSGKRALAKGWNPIQIDTLTNGKPQYTCESGPATGTSDLYVAVDGLPAGQTIQIRAIEYAQVKGKWTRAKSYGVSEHQTTTGATFAHRTQVIKVPAGRRLSWEINVPQPCHQVAGTTRDLVWKKVIR